MVLLVVDAQNGIVDERLYEFRKFVGNIKKLIGAAREQCIEVICWGRCQQHIMNPTVIPVWSH